MQVPCQQGGACALAAPPLPARERWQRRCPVAFLPAWSFAPLLFGAFGKASMVLVAAISVAVAGALSMAAGAWAGASSAAEVERTERGRRRFLGEKPAQAHVESPLSGAVVVGASYLAGSLIPVLPVLFGAHTLLLPALTASVVIVLVSIVVSFLSGMRLRRRIAMNLIVIFAAVGVSYAIGSAVKEVFGVVV